MHVGRIAKQKTSERVVAREEEEESESERDPVLYWKRKLCEPHTTLDHGTDVEMDDQRSGGDPSEVIGSLSARKGKAVPKLKKPIGPSDAEEDGDVEQILRPHRKANGRLSHSTIEPSSSPHAPVSPTKSTHTPKRRVSVLVPTIASVYSSHSKRQALPETPRDSTSSNKLVRTRSIHAEAAEEPSVSPTKRVQPTTSSKRRVADKSGLSESTLPHKPSHIPVHAADATSDQAPSSSARLTRTPSKRSAATKATQKLHDEIMPDVMNFQRELKNGTVRATWETGQTPAASKSKNGEAGGEEGKTKANKRRSTGGDESSAFNEDEPDRKRRRTISTTMAKGHPNSDRRGSFKRKLNEESSEDEANETAKGRKSRNMVKIDTEGAVTKASSTRASPKTIQIMTTQVNLSDDVARALTPEADDVLADPENEKKFGFKLTDALHRAKTNRKIFAGMTFYVTPKVPIAKLLRNVVVAGGGQLHIQVPSMRILNGHDHRYVISSSSELSTCRPLVENGYPIYTQELILTGALRQEIDWDDPAYKVAGSFAT
ncbi:hypothetical protein A0H81_01581 [Grifola frondosa]|uniref:BRCT domain-containing protein n=1 Tax=Grifola frondosa TaxID=5627 RepID=A0A1C7MSE8_GRIFR|nr:hypothetical protein A0H81_01581 [Grifola frondosa]